MFEWAGSDGGLAEGFCPAVQGMLGRLPKYIDDVHKLNTNSRIFKQRAIGVTAISGKDAIDWGITGPMLRADREILMT